MEQDSSSDAVAFGTQPGQPQGTHQKRARVLLSCGPCRASKLKCDREQPCGQCLKREKGDQCGYAPRPEKRKPARGMSARLKRLEGMVRDMMDTEGGGSPSPKDNALDSAAAPMMQTKVVSSESTTNYLGATHCMAMLEDIEDLKTYFEEDEEDAAEDGSPLGDKFEAEELLLSARVSPRNREELISFLPDRKIADRLIMRYFESMSPSQHIVHHPSFMKEYARFWQNPQDPSLTWVAQLFMMLALGILFNSHIAPHELYQDSSVPIEERMTQYRSCAGWALSRGRFTHPNMTTLAAFLLYVDAHFIMNRASQMDCYILSGVCIRLMLKMGLHREPSKVGDISPFEAEMRRRMWNMAVQIDLLVSFHMGLPSMLQGIESDSDFARNLQDSDFGPDSAELPLSRPDTDWTTMSYPIFKTRLVRVFGEIAKSAHALTPPTYSEIMQLDTMLNGRWRSVPPFMKVRPLEECAGEPPTLLMQRFGIGSMYNKCRCVMHRRYLAEPIPKPEHNYSRRQCIEGALTLLDFQATVWEACQSGGVLSANRWFIASLSVHDYLLAVVCLNIVIKSDQFWEAGDEPTHVGPGPKLPTRLEMIGKIRRSHEIWLGAAAYTPQVRKTAETVGALLAKLDPPPGGLVPESHGASQPQNGPARQAQSVATSSSVGLTGNTSDGLASYGYNTSTSGSNLTPSSHDNAREPTMFGSTVPELDTGANDSPGALDIGPTWMLGEVDSMDWRYLDVSLAHSYSSGAANQEQDPSLLEGPSMDEMDLMTNGIWNQPLGGNGADGSWGQEKRGATG